MMKFRAVNFSSQSQAKPRKKQLVFFYRQSVFLPASLTLFVKNKKKTMVFYRQRGTVKKMGEGERGGKMVTKKMPLGQGFRNILNFCSTL